MSAYRIFLDI